MELNEMDVDLNYDLEQDIEFDLDKNAIAEPIDVTLELKPAPSDRPAEPTSVPVSEPKQEDLTEESLDKEPLIGESTNPEIQSAEINSGKYDALDSLNSLITEVNNKVYTNVPNRQKRITPELMCDIRSILDRDIGKEKTECIEARINAETEKQRYDADHSTVNNDVDNRLEGEVKDTVFTRRSKIGDGLLEGIPDFIDTILESRKKAMEHENVRIKVSSEDVFSLFNEDNSPTEQQKIAINNGAPLGALLMSEEDSLFEFMSECVYSTTEGYVLDSDIDYVYSSEETDNKEV